MAAPSEVIATTLKYYLPRVIDNIAENTPFLAKLKEKGGDSYKIVDGGDQFYVPVYKAECTVASYADDDILTTTIKDVMDKAVYEQKQLAGLISFTGKELAQNQGSQKVIDLVRAKTRGLEISSDNELDAQLMGDGTGNSNKDLDGLQKLITDADGGSVGGISRTNSWWQNYNYATQVTIGGSGGTLKKQMNIAWRKVTIGKEHPDLVLTTDDIYAEYEAALQANERILQDKQSAIGKLGFEHYMYKSAPVLSGDNVASDHLYFINTDYIGFWILGGGNFKVDELRKPINQDVFVQTAVLYANLVLMRAGVHGVLSNVS